MGNIVSRPSQVHLHVFIWKFSWSDCQVSIRGRDSACNLRDAGSFRLIHSVILWPSSGCFYSTSRWLDAAPLTALNDAAGFGRMGWGSIPRISGWVASFALGVGFSSGNWVWSCGVIHVSGLIKCLLWLSNYLTFLSRLIVWSVSRIRLVSRNQLLAVQVVCKSPVFLLFLDFLSVFSSESGLIISFIVEHRLLSVSRASFSAHQPPL